MKKKHIRIAVDIVMTVLLLMLMAYSLIGEELHEIIGTAIFVLYIAHHILNRGWYKAVFKGKYSLQRIIRTVIDIMLVITMIAQPVSGILLSKHLYTFIKINGVSATAREVHMLFAYWGFVLLCVHIGTHISSPVKKLWKKSKSTGIALTICSVGISAFGVIAFINRQLADYMFRKMLFVFFDTSEPIVFFFLDYAAIMVLFASVGCVMMLCVSTISGRKNDHRKQNNANYNKSVRTLLLSCTAPLFRILGKKMPCRNRAE